MSVGKTEKAKHVPAATNYRDIDGNMKTFTHIDYDLHTTKLKSWKGRDYSPIPLTSNQQLCEDILILTAEDEQFIQEFDKLLKEYGSERLRKGTEVNYNSLYQPHYGQVWFDQLKELYERVQK